MDVPRQAPPKRRRWIRAVAVGLGLILSVVVLARLRPAAQEAERQSLIIDTVKQGAMVFQVRGTGTLVPLNVRWIAANSDSRVEKILVWPGTEVKADSEILVLSNPEVQQAAQDAMWQMRAAEADYTSAKARLESQLLDLRASLATAKANSANAKMALDSNERLSKLGLISGQDLARSQVAAEDLTTRYDIERQRLQIGEGSVQAQLASQQARVQQARALFSLKQGLVDGLRVRAGMDGVLQQLPVQVGQRIAAGGTLAKVAQPAPLKAELKISETQAKDILIGQKASVDTRNGLVEGKVIRIDPAVQNGTVTVDVSLDSPLPKGARPDLSVEGVIELDHAENAIFVGRPVQSQSNSEGTIFKISSNGDAARVKVRYGRGSVGTIEVLEGLRPGDQVVISDASQWDGSDRIRIR